MRRTPSSVDDFLLKTDSTVHNGSSIKDVYKDEAGLILPDQY